MAGFKAAEAIEELSYDFNPYANEKGVISEPSSDQIDGYRTAVVASIKGLGIDPSTLTSGEGISLEDFGNLMEKSSGLEVTMLTATAELTGLDHDMLDGLPYRVKQAFLGWMMGLFFSPEV